MIRIVLLALVLLSCGYWQSARATDYAPCRATGYLRTFDPRLQPQPCELITTAVIHWRGGTAQIRAIRPTSMPQADAGNFIADLNLLARRMGAAMDQMGNNLRLNTVTLLVVNYVSPFEAPSGRDPGVNKGAVIAETMSDGDHECPVSYYKQRTATSGDDFVFTLAHELFHCIEFKTWPHMDDDGWLSEGGAEYFAHLAKPGHAGDFVASFDANARATPLDHLVYQAVVFHLWLGSARGPEAVGRFLGSTHSIQAAVSPDMWLEFEKAYYDHAIRFPDGRVVPTHPEMGPTKQVSGDDTLPSRSYVRYTVHNESITFARGKTYEITYGSHPPDMVMAWRKAEGGEWKLPMTAVSTCDAAQTFLIAWGGSRDGETGGIRIHARPASAAECTCPAGTWQETPASTRRSEEQSAMGGGGRRYISGNRVLQLNPDHTGSLTYDNVESETRDNPDFWLHQVKTGGTHFTWKVVNGTLLTVLSHGNNLVTLHNELHARGGATTETRQAGAQSIGHSFHCDEAGLHLVGPQGHRPSYLPPGMAFNYSVDMDFVRLGGAPETPPDSRH